MEHQEKKLEEFFKWLEKNNHRRGKIKLKRFFKCLEKSNYCLDNVEYIHTRNYISIPGHKIRVKRAQWCHEIYNGDLLVSEEFLAGDTSVIIEKFKSITNNFMSLEKHIIGYSFSKHLHEELIELLSEQNIEHYSSESLYNTPTGALTIYKVEVKLDDIKSTWHLKNKYINTNTKFETRPRWLPMFWYGNDYQLILEVLDNRKELAFLVPAEEGEYWQSIVKWKAVNKLPDQMSENFQSSNPHFVSLWHTESAPIPWKKTSDSIINVPEPFKGWTTDKPGFLNSTHYRRSPDFPICHSGMIDLRIIASKSGEVGRAALDWMVSDLSDPPFQTCGATKTLWNKLEKDILKITKEKIKLEDEHSTEVYCLPEAYAYLNNGGQLKNRDSYFFA